MLKLLSTGYDSDKHPFISVSLSAASSFFLFYLLHAAVVVTRHSLDAAGYSISSYHAWMLTVRQTDRSIKSGLESAISFVLVLYNPYQHLLRFSVLIQLFQQILIVTP